MQNFSYNCNFFFINTFSDKRRKSKKMVGNMKLFSLSFGLGAVLNLYNRYFLFESSRASYLPGVDDNTGCKILLLLSSIQQLGGCFHILSFKYVSHSSSNHKLFILLMNIVISIFAGILVSRYLCIAYCFLECIKLGLLHCCYACYQPTSIMRIFFGRFDNLDMRFIFSYW